jgi:hypothetical protein
LPAGYTAFGDELSYERLARALGMGAEIRETTLSENFDFDDYHRRYYKKAITLFAIDSRERLHILTSEHKLKPAPGWALLSLVEPQEAKQPVSEGAIGEIDEARPA